MRQHSKVEEHNVLHKERNTPTADAKKRAKGATHQELLAFAGPLLFPRAIGKIIGAFSFLAHGVVGIQQTCNKTFPRGVTQASLSVRVPDQVQGAKLIHRKNAGPQEYEHANHLHPAFVRGVVQREISKLQQREAHARSRKLMTRQHACVESTMSAFVASISESVMRYFATSSAPPLHAQ